LAAVHGRALRALVENLRRRRFAVNETSRIVRGVRAGDRNRASSRTRYVGASVRRAVLLRDQARCTYVDDSGCRCGETGGLELHHLTAHALGGPPSIGNLTLRSE